MTEVPGTERRSAVILAAFASVFPACTAVPDTRTSTDPADADGTRPPPAVVIDGRFDDWETGETEGASTLEVRDDAGAVYLAIPLPRLDNIQGLDGAVLLALDADDDSTSGVRAFDLPGADLVISFTRLAADGDPGHGITWWRPDPAEPNRVVPPSGSGGPADLGLWFEPRHTASRVELRLARDRPDDRYWTGRGFAGRLLYLDRAGGGLGETPVFRHTLRTERAGSPSPPPEVDLSLADGGDFRLLSWNVAGTRIVRDPQTARGIIQALDPDLVLLDEVPPSVTADDVAALLPGGAAGGWAVHVGSSGGRQRGVVAVRGEVAPAPSFARVEYADQAPEPGGVPATGAWVVRDGRRLLTVTLDLVCCGNSIASVQDEIRRTEAGSINAAIRSALRDDTPPAGSDGSEPSVAVVVGGDFNLVGSRAPLDIVGSGVGANDTALEVVYALQLDGATSATWTSGTGPFPPGQLDYVLYSAEHLTVLRAFVFETADLPQDQLGALGLIVGDSDRASDHRPIVVDFAWRAVP